jgi:CheY-like chemotaxis protein
MGSILVIEDDKGIRESVKKILEFEGHEVILASNGFEALELLSSGTTPGLILLDLMMPVMDGFKFCEHLKKLAKGPRTPVIVMSADGNVVKKQAAVGAAAYLRKPVDLNDLLDAVSTHLAG